MKGSARRSPSAGGLKASLLAVALALAGCAGYRGGWESVPYVGDTPADLAEPGERRRPELQFPGLRLQVSIDNQLRTYDNQVYLFVLPLGIDPRNVYAKNHVPGRTRVFVSVTASETGFVFRPTRAVLTVAGKSFSGVEGFEFAMWNAQGERVERGGTWEHRGVGAELALTDVFRRYLLSIDFATPVPSPELPDIAVDLSQALGSPPQPALPVIRFAPARWKEGYT
jgi:hypothetical protein